jgi:hypothetical protein
MPVLLRAILLAVGFLMAVIGPAAAEPCKHAPAFAITVSAPCAHDVADHESGAACPRGMAACWSHCPQIALTGFTTLPAAEISRPPFILDISGRDQDGPTRHLPPPKLFS